MPRLLLTRAITFRDDGVLFTRGQPVEITNEGKYHLLMRSGKVHDPDKDWRYVNPTATLHKLKPGTHVVVAREMGLGDVLMFLIVCRALKKKHPDLNFTLATGRNYIETIGLPDFLYDVRSLIDWKGREDYVVDLRGLSERSEFRKTMDRIDIFARYCGVKLTNYKIPVTASAEDREIGRALAGGNGRPILALTVRGSTRVRTWPIENVEAFVSLAADSGYQVALLDNERHEFEEREGVRNLTGAIVLLDVKRVISAAEFCVSPDTGLQHLAEAVGTKCLALYSTTPPALRIGHYRNVKALWRSDLPCAPCFERGCPPMTCVREITPEMVMGALERWSELPTFTNPKTFALVPASAQ